jgi:hypothetical protein
MSTTPANATVYAVRGQLFNITGVINLLSTGNGDTGNIAGATALISHNDGVFTSTTNSPTEILASGSTHTGVWSLDITADEMAYAKNFLIVTGPNAGDLSSYIEIRTLNLAQFTGRWDAQTPECFEQLWLDLFIGMALNGAAQTGAQLQLLNPDGSVHFQSSVTQNTTTGTRSKSM